MELEVIYLQSEPSLDRWTFSKDNELYIPGKTQEPIRGSF